MKPGLLQPATLVRVSDDATLTIRGSARAIEVVHRVPVLVGGGGDRAGRGDRGRAVRAHRPALPRA
jgi:hypothetical protein